MGTVALLPGIVKPHRQAMVRKHEERREGHDALGGDTPASRYTRSPRTYPLVNQHMGQEETDDGVWPSTSTPCCLAKLERARLRHPRVTSKVLPMSSDTFVTYLRLLSASSVGADEERGVSRLRPRDLI